ncbi:MAG TPA: ATP-binding protein [Abditibacteriaceae bacterium]|jgi:signal transduction histidine kinase/ActR/RegA family two-component response regulator
MSLPAGSSEAQSQEALQDRILILSPTGRDASLIEEVLSTVGMQSETCPDMASLCQKLPVGAGALLLAEEALATPDIESFHSCLAHQEPWSDLPVLVLTSGGYASRISLDTTGLLQASCNVTLLERPLRQETLISAAQAALRARRRQYQTRDLLNQLTDSVRQRDEFLAMLGHELRNPLFTIRTAIELLDQAAPSDRQTAHTHAIIERQTQHLSHLIDDLLDVARITQGKISLKLDSLDLNTVARNCLQAMEVSGATQNHRVSALFSPQPLMIEGDTVRLEQIFNNLLTNALKYTPSGGAIEFLVTREDNEAVVRVRDTGIGIDPELQPYIFDLFTQAKRSLDRSQGGLGIGLTVTHGLVQMHQGRIGVQSKGLGKGSTFEVRLPLSVPLTPTISTATSTDNAEPSESKSKRRIVVVEDNEDARVLMSFLLEHHGFEVQVAGDGLEGAELLLSARPEIALVDIGLPGMNGYEVARKVRATLGTAIFLIALTGYGQAEDQARALESGFDKHLTKPIEPQTLYRVLDEAIINQA